MGVEIRRGSARFTERGPGRLTHHAFSFGPHYDPDRLAWGPMVCHDDHVLGAGRGFDPHTHSGLVIVSTVLEGSLRHRGPDGEQVLHAGDVGVLHTGDGVEHAEHATDDGPCRFVQVWLRAPEDASATPRYDVVRAAEGQVLRSHEPDQPGLEIDLDNGGYSLVRLAPGERHALGGSPRGHVYVATGALLRFSLAEPLEAGDAVLVLDDPPDEPVVAAVPTLLLDWQLL